MEIVDDYMYVANSGGYRAPNYDNTVSVIQMVDFKQVQQIPVGINLHRLKKDKYNIKHLDFMRAVDDNVKFRTVYSYIIAHISKLFYNIRILFGIEISGIKPCIIIMSGV